MRLIRLVEYKTNQTLYTIHLGVTSDGVTGTACGLQGGVEGRDWRRVRGEHVVTCCNCEQTKAYREFYNPTPKQVDHKAEVVKAATTLVEFWRDGYGYVEEDLYPEEKALLDAVAALK